MDNLLPDFSKGRVLVVGDVMLDRYWHGNTSRISPEAPVPVVHVGDEEHRAGGAGNVALNISALGGNVTLIGFAGKDEAGESLEGILHNAGVNCCFFQQQGFSTITKLRVISHHQQLIRLDFEDSFAGADLRQLEQLFVEQLDSHDVVILSDYGKGALQDVQALIKLAKKADKTVLVDPKGSDFRKYAGATLITPNFSEFQGVVGTCPHEQIAEKGLELITGCDLASLLVTRGEHGMMLLSKDKEPLNLPTHAREVFDVTGAGDTVISVLGASLAAGSELPDAVKLSNVAAGVVVGKLGTATVSVTEIRCALHSMGDSNQKTLTEEQLLAFVTNAKENGEKLVMTNGCFDILHAGHVEYLQKASELGDRLIVAVNSDESVKILKGDSRPVNGLENRMAVLAGLQSVDWVVPFSEETPECLISSVLPDTLVKGGDYKVEEIAGGRQVQENGGDVVILSFKDGCSTTSIIDAIKSN
ncbi:MAG: bifunctional D-glycero-beta-D-manno-heptose-7-phosphate kinase/D-glycero-beta-D-manno-heptose 1-phosphate adenylyltransferase HldE [Gammaproteobacteria bacterium]|nr:MAG: bifunctional D-glycero-beta-D-manno-heptose-7-phosphate kinase/D-glycero-beta-D-manno-heptose 1-phosphate adenylyltransferase HldE [Gammaproteobacteria bacterium]